MLRVLDELLWALRRDGFTLSTAQALDAVRVVELLGLGDQAALRAGIGAVVLERAADRARFEAAFDRFFSPARAHPGDLWARLAERGFAPHELEALRDLLEAAAERTRGPGGAAGFLALMGTEAELDAILAAARIARALEPLASPLQIGFFAHRVADRLGIPRVASATRRLRDALREALGEERGGALGDALGAELEELRRRTRRHVEETLSRRTAEAESGERQRLEDRSFASLSDEEIEEVRRAVRRLAERLRGRERVRRKRARRGRIDARRTLRASLATGGVPFRPARRARRRDKPKIMVLCDVSESVRTASRFMLELVYAVQDLFAGTRSFVFVSDLGETTELFERRTPDAALGAIASGRVVSGADNSNYGRALRAFEATHGRGIDRRTTVVILGDGRTNYHEDEAAIVRRLRERARAVLWICPEGQGGWGSGDSAMPRYAAAATKVLVARTARELEAAAREVVAWRQSG